jgi:hypothetical protein
MSSILEKINALVEKAKATLAASGSSSEFMDAYADSDNGLVKEIKDAELVFPIQFEDTGDFYFFAEASDLVIYILDVLRSEGLLDDEGEYYESSDEEWQNSGC